MQIYPIATGMAKGTWWIKLYRESSNWFFESLRLTTHELIIAKCEAYGFDNISLKLFQSYFLNRKQRVKLGSAISEQIDILIGIPQGFISGLLIFNIFINDLIMFIEKICNFADDILYDNLVRACR